jgi:hypothetical protein
VHDDSSGRSPWISFVCRHGYMQRRLQRCECGLQLSFGDRDLLGRDVHGWRADARGFLQWRGGLRHAGHGLLQRRVRLQRIGLLHDVRR